MDVAKVKRKRAGGRGKGEYPEGDNADRSGVTLGGEGDTDADENLPLSRLRERILRGEGSCASGRGGGQGVGHRRVGRMAEPIEMCEDDDSDDVVHVGHDEEQNVVGKRERGVNGGNGGTSGPENADPALIRVSSGSPGGDQGPQVRLAI